MRVLCAWMVGLTLAAALTAATTPSTTESQSQSFCVINALPMQDHTDCSVILSSFPDASCDSEAYRVLLLRMCPCTCANELFEANTDTVAHLQLVNAMTALQTKFELLLNTLSTEDDQTSTSDSQSTCNPVTTGTSGTGSDTTTSSSSSNEWDEDRFTILSNQVQSLVTQDLANQARILTLETQVQSLTNQIQTLSSSSTSDTTTVTNPPTDNTNTTTSDAIVTAQLQTLTSQVLALSAEDQAIQAQVNALTVEDQSLLAQVEALTTQGLSQSTTLGNVLDVLDTVVTQNDFSNLTHTVATVTTSTSDNNNNTTSYLVGDLKMATHVTDHAGWLLCNGTIHVTSVWPMVASALRNDTGSTFTLPDPSGRVVGVAGSGLGLTSRAMGALVGVETTSFSLTTANIPSHYHYVGASGSGTGTYPTSSNHVDISGAALSNSYYALEGTSTTPSRGRSSSTGSGTAVTGVGVMQPTMFMGNMFIYAGQPTCVAIREDFFNYCIVSSCPDPSPGALCCETLRLMKMDVCSEVESLFDVSNECPYMRRTAASYHSELC